MNSITIFEFDLKEFLVGKKSRISSENSISFLRILYASLLDFLLGLEYIQKKELIRF